jgi:peptidoglycan/LPS O-acetylase OafA/YrhL
MVMLWLFPKTARMLGPALGGFGTMAVAGLAAVVLSFAFATLLYLFVEQPSMRARSLPGVKRFTERAAAMAPVEMVG